MSKQSDAKAAQRYTKESPKCGNCKQFTCEMVLPAWMVEDNASNINRGYSPRFDGQHKVAKNKRCGLGGFAIGSSGWCQQHEREAA